MKLINIKYFSTEEDIRANDLDNKNRSALVNIDHISYIDEPIEHLMISGRSAGKYALLRLKNNRVFLIKPEEYNTFLKDHLDNLIFRSFS